MWWLVALAHAEDGTAWILQDRASREDGVFVQVDGFEVDASLPVEVQGDVGLAVQVDERLKQGWVRPGFVYLVQGDQGRVRVARPGIDVATDVVRVKADAQTAHALAEDVGASVVPDGDDWILRAPGLLGELSRAPVPEAEFELVLLPPDAAVVVGGGEAPARKARTERVRSRSRGVFRARARGLQLGEGSGSVVARLEDHGRFGGVVPEGAPRPDDVGWYFLPDGWLALGVDGNAHWCPAPEGVAAPTPDGQPEVGPTCADAGRWAAREGGFQVGAEAYAWRAAGLVRVLP